MNLGKVEIWETSLDRIVTLREGAKGVLHPTASLRTSAVDPRRGKMQQYRKERITEERADCEGVFLLSPIETALAAESIGI